jgi:hypothetical protein
MSSKPSDSPAHPYEPEPYPLLRQPLSEFSHMPEGERSRLLDYLARKLGGEGWLPRRGNDQEQGR